MKACLTSDAMSAEEATRLAVEGEGVIGMDYVREVSTKGTVTCGIRTIV